MREAKMSEVGRVTQDSTVLIITLPRALKTRLREAVKQGGCSSMCEFARRAIDSECRKVSKYDGNAAEVA